MKRLLSANLPEKLAALAIALLVWQVQLRQQPMSSASFENVPVSYRQAPPGLYPTNAVKSMHVDATVMIGAEGTSIDKDKITLWVDLSKGKPGKSRYPVNWSYATGGVRISPRWEFVDVTLEQLTEKVLPVTAQVTGLWDSYRPGPVTINPSKVRISGPESVIERAHEARVIVDLSRIDPGSATEATVQILQMNGSPLDMTVDPPRVTVSVKPVAIPPEKAILVQPTWLGSPAFGYRIEEFEIVPNQIRVRGPSELLARLLSVDTVRIDISGISESKTVRAKLLLPTGVTSDTNEVEVRIYVQQAGETANR